MIVYVPGANPESGISPFSSVVNVFEKSFGPVKWNLIPLITPSSDVLMSFIPPTEVIEPENAIETGS